MAENGVTVVFPHQLFASHPAMRTGRRVLLVEDERFFSAHRFHKQKLVLHRASMQIYAQALAGKRHLTTVPFDESGEKAMVKRLGEQKIDQIHTADLCDHALADKLRRIAKIIDAKWTTHPAPMFITPNERLDSWFYNRKHLHMASFYQTQRKALDVLLENGKPVGGKWSFDTENRKRLPKGIQVPRLPVLKTHDAVKEAIEYVNKRFPNNPGRAEDFRYPVSRRQAQVWLKSFLTQRFVNFGPYEDAMSQDQTFLFHSVLTPLLNIGLLNPQQLVEQVLAFSREQDFPLASVEGFLRQVIGWREFMWGVYRGFGMQQRGSNFWNCQNRIPQTFYEGTTGISPLDIVIRRVQDHAYCHHIERLMVLGNFMLLCEIHPDEVYRWFMELFIDSYDWVMVPNVYGMSQYADGGRMTTKPYISSSNYIRKMSDFPKGPWCDIWDGLFWRFVGKHRKVFAGNPRMRMMALQWDRMDSIRKRRHLSHAEAFLVPLFGRV